MSKLIYLFIFIFILFNSVNSQECTSTPDCDVVDSVCYSLIACIRGTCVRERIENCCLDFLTCFNRSTSCLVVYCNFETHLCESIDNCTTTTTTTTGSASATTSQTSFSSYSSISTTTAQTISSYLSSGQTTFSSGEGQYAGPLFEECLNCIDINCGANFGLCKVIPIDTSSSKCKSWKPRLLLNPNKSNNNQNQIDIINEDSNPYYTGSSSSGGSDSSPYYTGSSISGGSGNTGGKRIRHPKLGHHCCPYIPTCF